MVPGPAGELEVLTVGHGSPHTLFAHGLAGSVESTRPYATKVAGTRSFLHFRGHGSSPMPPVEAYGYGDLAAELWAVADAVGADRALGISMGAGALVSGLARDPRRFERVVLVIPASLDRPREGAFLRSFENLADALEAGDVERVTALLVLEQPPAVRRESSVLDWCRDRAGELLATGPGLVTALRTVPHHVPLRDREALAEVTCPVLVLAQEGDELHTVEVARELAEALPRGILKVMGPGGIMWEHRRETRELVGQFLSTS